MNFHDLKVILNVPICFSWEECFVCCYNSVKRPLHLKHKQNMTQRSFDKLSKILRCAIDRYVTERISDRYKLNINSLKVILNVAAYVSWAEWFVSLSWSKNSDEVTTTSVNLFYYTWKRVIMSQTWSMNQKCSYKLNHKNLIKMWQRGFLTDSNWISTLSKWC